MISYYVDIERRAEQFYEMVRESNCARILPPVSGANGVDGHARGVVRTFPRKQCVCCLHRVNTMPAEIRHHLDEPIVPHVSRQRLK
eukprot:2923854-Pyramimonas_sp.AAC.2